MNATLSMRFFATACPRLAARFCAASTRILDRAIGDGCPLTVSIAGPVTVSGQHQAWLIPLLETGWVAYLSTTDAVCYHDGHRSLNEHTEDPIYEVPIFGDDGKLRDEGVIRVTDMGFDEAVLLDQDKFLTAVLQRPEFQKKMTGTELRYRLGALLRGSRSSAIGCSLGCFRRATGWAFRFSWARRRMAACSSIR